MVVCDGIVLSNLKKRKVYSESEINTGNLRRCLTRWDLTALGFGSSLGIGVHVLTGYVARYVAGPSVLVSVAVAAVAATFAGLCYAEIAARVPKAGTAYSYTHVCLGELAAFVVGWGLIFECVVGSAAVAKGLSMMLDSLTNGTMGHAFLTVAPMGDGVLLAAYFDFFAMAVVIVIATGLAFGLRVSASVNNVLAISNVVIVLFTAIAGALYADPANWSISEAELPDPSAGGGGFFPFGTSGTLQGAALCFYGFVGLHSITAGAEEVEKPRGSVPFAISLSIASVFLGCVGVSTVVTMMVPYYALSVHSPLSEALVHAGLAWARWPVSVSALFGVCASLFGSIYPLPRILYSMARDRLLFKYLGRVGGGSRSPVVATLLSALVIGVTSALVELRHLVSLLALGTLLAYATVSTCVLLLRYRPDVIVVTSIANSTRPRLSYRLADVRSVMKQLVGVGPKCPTSLTANIATSATLLFVITSAGIGMVHRFVLSWPLIYVGVLAGVAMLLVILIALQPSNPPEFSFKVPLVPLIPCLSIFVNVYLMTTLSAVTWICFISWIIIGIPIYLLCMCMYGRPKISETNGHLQTNMVAGSDGSTEKNCKPSVTFVMNSPTPPPSAASTLSREAEMIECFTEFRGSVTVNKTLQSDELSTPDEGEREIQQFEIEKETCNNKETQVIELLDQVLQEEENSYKQMDNVTDINDMSENSSVNMTPQALTKMIRLEMSDAESLDSEAPSPTYDVVALIHREDLPKVGEVQISPTNAYSEQKKSCEVIKHKHEQIELTEKAENNLDSKIEEMSNEKVKGNKDYHENKHDTEIPSLVELNSNENRLTDDEIGDDPDNNRRSSIIIISLSDSESNDKNVRPEMPNIPPPPPMNENIFCSPSYKKAHTIIVIPRKSRESAEEHFTRERTFSGSSPDDTVMVFGSDKQANFMNKLNDILQNKKSPPKLSNERRSISTSHITQADKGEFVEEIPRPTIMLDLKKELLSRRIKDGDTNEMAKTETKFRRRKNSNNHKDDTNKRDKDDVIESTMSRADLKSKLENIFAIGGGMMLKPRLVSSNLPSPENSPQDTMYDCINSPGLKALKKETEKNDTLKMQKAKFGAVLDSFRHSLVKDSETF